jgi:23S rRNA (cytidine2498-2'-O)-methyltransferase
VVDLGGAPGGWAFTALGLGAKVTAVDRSPLVAPALGHPHLEMILGNAFNYRPPAPVDWLLCDVICEPTRTLALVETWMREGLCRRVVATLKFKGEGDYGLLREVRTRLGRLRWPFIRLKHLHHHSNEVAILATR